jgi:hypothetical protein
VKKKKMRKIIQNKSSEESIPGIGELMRIAVAMDSTNALRIDDGKWEAVKEFYDQENCRMVKRIAVCSFKKNDEGKFVAKCVSPDLKVVVIGKKRDITNIILLRSMLSVGYRFRKRK